MQQQAAIMASVAQGGYLNPMAAFAAAQMQQMAALNMNGLAATPMTPTSGKDFTAPGSSVVIICSRAITSGSRSRVLYLMVACQVASK